MNIEPNRTAATSARYCDLANLTTGNSYEDLPFLVKGRP
jgi:hypothetical protein